MGGNKEKKGFNLGIFLLVPFKCDSPPLVIKSGKLSFIT